MRQRVVSAALSLSLCCCAFMVMAADVLHGPLKLPSAESQTLTFNQAPDRVAVLVADDGRAAQEIDSYAKDAQIVAVFYHDFDGDQQREAVVMYRDSNGQQLSAYGMQYLNWQSLTHAQAKLAALAQQLPSFTVAATRKALKTWPLNNYLIGYSTAEITDPQLQQLMKGEYAQAAKFMGYRDMNDQPVTDPAKAERYLLQYPASISETIDGQLQQFFLTQEFSRDAYNMANDGSGFMLTRVGYYAPKTKQYSGERLDYQAARDGWAELDRLSHFSQGQLNGNVIDFGERNGAARFSGNYVAGQRQGRWTQTNEDDETWVGNYQQDQRQGEWLQLDRQGRQVGVAHYQQGKLDGDYRQTAPDYDQQDDTARVVVAQGRYQIGVKQGHWQERFAQGGYVDGLREGEWQFIDGSSGKRMVEHYQQGKRHGDSQTFNAAGELISQYQFANGKRNGLGREFYPNGNIKKQAHYRDNLKHGEFLSFYENGQPRFVIHYKITEQDGKTVSVKTGQALGFFDDGSLNYLHNLANDKRQGTRYEYQQKTGKLTSFFQLTSAQQGVGGRMNANGQLTYFFHSWQGRNVGASYQFYNDGVLKEIEPWCQQIDEVWQGQPYSYPPGNFRCGIRQSFHPNGNIKCMRHYVEGYEQDYQCFSPERVLLQSRELTAPDRALEQQFYASGVLKKQMPKFAKHSKKIKGRVVHSFNGTYYDGVVTEYSAWTRQPTYKYLYQKGKLLCSHKLDLLGNATAKPKGCKIAD